jgi:hypothetical protein
LQGQLAAARSAEAGERPAAAGSALQRLVARLVCEPHNACHAGDRIGHHLDVVQFDGQRRLRMPRPPELERLDDRLATFERNARGATCVRRVWGVRQIGDAQDADGSSVDDLWGAFRLTAHGGRLVAVSDDGRTVATFPMTLHEGVGFSEY